MYSTPHLVSDTFPPSQVGPGGGYHIYIYISNLPNSVVITWGSYGSDIYIYIYMHNSHVIYIYIYTNAHVTKNNQTLTNNFVFGLVFQHHINRSTAMLRLSQQSSDASDGTGDLQTHAFCTLDSDGW